MCTRDWSKLSTRPFIKNLPSSAFLNFHVVCMKCVCPLTEVLPQVMLETTGLPEAILYPRNNISDMFQRCKSHVAKLDGS
jgi:hypothetical protein